MKLFLITYSFLFILKGEHSTCSNFIILKEAADKNEFISNDVFLGCVGEIGNDYFNDFYGENVVEYNNLTMLEFSTVQHDTFIRSILVFDLDTLVDVIFLSTEKLVNEQTSIIFGDIGYFVNKQGCLALNKYTFSPVYIDSLDSKFAREVDAMNIKIDSLRFCPH